jgi:hypothetical protein
VIYFDQSVALTIREPAGSNDNQVPNRREYAVYQELNLKEFWITTLSCGKFAGEYEALLFVFHNA